MLDDKEQIKVWLKEHNRDRVWLAAQLGKALQTVNNWLSSAKPIPDNITALIRRMMQDDEAAESARRQQLMPTAQVFSLEVDLATYRAYCAASLQHGQTLEQWAIDELNAAAEAAMKQPKTEAPSNVQPGAETAAA